MKRFAMLALVLASGMACDKSPTTPSDPNVARFTAILLPANEVPPVTNTDATASGTMQLTMTVTRDAANNITGATYDFQIHVTGFPEGTTLTGAHIHAAPVGVAGPIVVPLTPPNASGVSSGCVNADKELVKAIRQHSENYYVNVHTSDFPAGAVRGQLSK